MALSSKRPPPIRHPQYGSDLQPLADSDQLQKPWANYYRDLSAGVVGVPNFADAELPVGTVDGANALFTLANAPNPQASLILLKNGLKMRAGVSFNLVGKSITFIAGHIPQNTGGNADILEAYYRF